MPKPKEIPGSFDSESKDSIPLDTKPWKEFDAQMTLDSGHCRPRLAPLAEEEDDFECFDEFRASRISQAGAEVQVWKVHNSD